MRGFLSIDFGRERRSFSLRPTPKHPGTEKTSSNQGIVAETVNKITMLTFMVKKEK